MVRDVARITISITPEQKKLLRLWSDEQDKSASAIVRQLIKQEEQKRKRQKLK